MGGVVDVAVVAAAVELAAAGAWMIAEVGMKTWGCAFQQSRPMALMSSESCSADRLH